MTIPCISCAQETNVDDLESVPLDDGGSRGQLCPACAASLRAAPSFGAWLDLQDTLRRILQTGRATTH